MRLLFLVLLALLFSTGCTSDDSRFDKIQKQLTVAQQLWQQNEPEYYRYNYNLGCFCGVSGLYDVSVINGEFILARSLITQEVDNHLSEQLKPFLYSVDDSFRLIQQAINDEAYTLEVSFDSEYGYPTAITIDGDLNIADDELSLSFSFTETGTSEAILDDVDNWKVASLTTIAGASPILYETEITLKFDIENNIVSGNSGCNSYSADFSIIDGQINVAEIATTDAFCLGPDGVMEQEFNFLGGLSGEHNIEFNSYQLTLSKFSDMSVLLVPQRKSTEETLNVLSFRKSCDVIEMGEMLCHVIENANNEDELFSDTIVGFESHWGINYEVAVQVLEIPYTTIRIGNAVNNYFYLSTLFEITDDIGTLYRDDNFIVSQNTFRSTDTNNTYQLIDNTLFTCADTVDCTQLTSLHQTNSLVDVTFRYTGVTEIPLELVLLSTD